MLDGIPNTSGPKLTSKAIMAATAVATETIFAKSRLRTVVFLFHTFVDVVLAGVSLVTGVGAQASVGIEFIKARAVVSTWRGPALVNIAITVLALEASS